MGTSVVLRFEATFGVDVQISAANLPLRFEAGHVIDVRRMSEVDARGVIPTHCPLLMIVSGSHEVSGKKRAAAFEALAEHRLPEGCDRQLIEEANAFGSALLPGTVNTTVPVGSKLLPQAQNEVFLSIGEEARELGERTARLLRWVGQGSASHRFVFGPEMRWAIRDGDWQRWPGYSSVRIGWSRMSDLSEANRSLVTQYLNTDIDEPIYHRLWREAEALRTSSRRAALMIAVAAAEIGLKKVIAELIPSAKWLVDETPSPPLVKMLKAYFPTLPVREQLSGSVWQLEPDDMETLETAVNLRNKSVHTDHLVDDDRLEKSLNVVKRLLQRYDVALGYRFALPPATPRSGSDPAGLP